MFSCVTCNHTGDAVDINKHLLTTRHKSVKTGDEILECEDCEDVNIHQLLLLRYGLSYMALLCSQCSASNDAPTAQYTVSNGSLFQKLDQYFKLRDMECQYCGSLSGLSVGNLLGKQVIVCKKCLPTAAEEHKTVFVSEKDERFLTALLGITEHVAASHRGSRKVGRKGGKQGSRKSKVLLPDAEERRAHYQNKMATAKAIKSGSTVKAVGSNPVSAAGSRVPSRSATPKLEKSGIGARDGGRSGTSKGANNGKSAARKDKGTRGANNSPVSNGNPGKEPGQKFGQHGKSSRLIQAQNSASKSKRDSGSKGGPGPQNGANREKNDGKKSAKAPDKASNTPRVDKLLAQTGNDNARAGKDTSAKSNGRIKDERNGKTQNKAAANGPEVRSKLNSKTAAKDRQLPTQSAEVPLPSGVYKYVPSNKPPLSYPALDVYFREMSYLLFTEEKLSMATSNTSFLQPEDMALEWYQEQDKKHRQFKISVVLTEEFLGRFLSRKMQQLKKTPFGLGLAVILMLGDDVAWYAQIVTSDTMSAKKGRKNGPKMLEMVAELYRWNDMPLPLSVNVRHIRILPVSVPVSRVFMAMSRITNPKFISMLLGNEPIRQIVFRNFLTFKNRVNQSQQVAVQSVLNNAITVLQGPPGTGKTSTIYEIILQLIENLHTFPILVVAASNIAIDNIAEKLLEKHGREILRIVSNEKEKEYTRDHPLGGICLHHKVYDALPQQMKQTVDELRRPGGAPLSQNAYKKLLSQQIEYLDTFTAQAKVIFTTTVVAGGNQLKLVKKLPVVIMDEATQSSEPTTLIPLSMPGVDKFVFVGDQRQLSSFSMVPNLSLSLFERVLLNNTYRNPHMLDTQYRMHPAISEFPRLRFYGGLLQDGITAEDRLMATIPENPVYFWNTAGRARESRVRSGFREDRGYTYSNPDEVDYVARVLTTLIYDKGVPRTDIGVITPYRGQRDLLSSRLVRDPLINPDNAELQVEVDRDDIYNDSKPVTVHLVSGIMVASVDAFQGREKNFLVMSCVRSNSERKIGFLSDQRRLNVALTRAKYGLVLVGDVATLKGDELWTEYLEFLEKKGSVHEGDLTY